MATQTLVSVYQVEGSGNTGPAAGSASLVDPLAVLVHPPLSGQLAQLSDAPAADDPDVVPAAAYRLGLCGTDGTDGVEVIDAVSVHVVTAGDQPVVLLELATASTAPVEAVMAPFSADGQKPDPAALTAALQAFLAELPQAQPHIRPELLHLASSPLCWIDPHLSFCRH